MGNANPFQSLPPKKKPRRPGGWSDRVFGSITGAAGILIVLMAIGIVVLIYRGASESIHTFGLSFLWGPNWVPYQPGRPGTDVYGALPFIVGTLLTSALALLIAVPLSLGAAIFLTQTAPRWMRGPVGMVIELLAAIPSVIFGFWGLEVLAPYMESTIEPGLQQNFGWTGLFNGVASGLDVLTASVILAIMIVPTITAIARDSLVAVPVGQREAATSLGATSWEATRVAMVPFARSGIIGGIILGLGRALGETMAVTLTIGNSNHVPTSLLSQGQTIASLIANDLLNTSSPLEYSALFEVALILLAISLGVNVVARVLVAKVVPRRVGGIE
jgi:phosphate transport system permease protein